MTARLMQIDDILEFLPLARLIHERAWPHIPFIEKSAARSMVEHVEDKDADIIIINDGIRKAMLSLQIVPLVANSAARIAAETAWGATQPAPRKTGDRLLSAARAWAKDHEASDLLVCLGGNRTGAQRFISKQGGDVLHTAGLWRL